MVIVKLRPMLWFGPFKGARGVRLLIGNCYGRVAGNYCLRNGDAKFRIGTFEVLSLLDLKPIKPLRFLRRNAVGHSLPPVAIKSSRADDEPVGQRQCDISGAQEIDRRKGGATGSANSNICSVGQSDLANRRGRI